MLLNIVRWTYKDNIYTVIIQIQGDIEPKTKFFVAIGTEIYWGKFKPKSNIISFYIKCDCNADIKFYRTTAIGNIEPQEIKIIKDTINYQDKMMLTAEANIKNKISLRKYNSITDYIYNLAENVMNIIFSFDERLAYFAPVTMVSLYRNHQNQKIDIYIIYVSLSDNVMSLIKHTVDIYQQNVFFIPCENGDDYNKFEKYSGTFECYFDLFAHIYLPRNVKRALYLDVDLYINKNISELYFSNFEDAWLIAVPDCGNSFRLRDGETDEVILASNGQGFNSGVIVINFEKFREADVSIQDYNKLIDGLNERGLHHFGDQALFNLFMLGKPIKYFSPLYNFLWLEHDAQNESLREYSLEDIFIFHCGGNEYKPWTIRLRKQDIELYESYTYIKKHRINERVVKINQGWWEYAKFAPNYTQLCSESMSFTHFLSVFNFQLVAKWKYDSEEANTIV